MKNTFFCDATGNMIVYHKDAEGNPPVFPKFVTPNQKSPGLELYDATEKAFSISPADSTEENIRIFERYGKVPEDKWFKFVLFQIHGRTKMYILIGNPLQNKHSVCLLYGIYEDNASPEYVALRRLMKRILDIKTDPRHPALTEESAEIIEFNETLYDNFGLYGEPKYCMDAIIAGSGTFLGFASDGKYHICVNPKSGHYKPSITGIRDAKDGGYFGQFFTEANWTMHIQPAPSESQLKKVYGSAVVSEHSGPPHEVYKNFAGTCLTPEQLAEYATKPKMSQTQRRPSTKTTSAEPPLDKLQTKRSPSHEPPGIMPQLKRGRDSVTRTRSKSKSKSPESSRYYTRSRK